VSARDGRVPDRVTIVRGSAGGLVLLALLGGLGSAHSSLEPESDQARVIADLWWWMLGGAVIGLALIAGLLLLAWIRRSQRGLGRDTEGQKPGERASTIVVLGLGVALPIVLLSTLFLIADVFVIRTTQAPAAEKTKLTVDVVGHQWWWEVRYPGTKAVTANELHIPVRTPVLVRTTTADVIHSFWVPSLNRKIDTIPGQVNAVELDADRVGTYRGECSEFCGLQHAHMSFEVVVEPESQFRAWLAREAKPTGPATSALEQRGRQIFLTGPCASCHALRGTSASGFVGPDLTHLASRATLGALRLENTPRGLASWITDSQHWKPGNQMPDFRLAPAQLRALVAYLESRR
jgi:cytochrome c oxidase subunit 2